MLTFEKHWLMAMSLILCIVTGCNNHQDNQADSLKEIMQRLHNHIKNQSPPFRIYVTGTPFVDTWEDLRAEVDWEPNVPPDLAREVASMASHLLAEIDSLNDDKLKEALIYLAGNTRDPRLVNDLMSIISEENSPRLRIAAVRALGLLGSQSATKSLKLLIGRNLVPAKHILWALAMLGEKGAELEYLRIVYLELYSQPPDHPTIFAPNFWMIDISESRTGDIDQSGDEVAIAPPSIRYEFPIARPIENLKEVSLLRSKESVEALIEHLNSNDIRLIQGALIFLRDIVDHDISPSTWELVTRGTFSRWKEWWIKNRELLRWDDNIGKFTLKGGHE